MSAGIILCIALACLFGCQIPAALKHDSELPVSHTGKKTRNAR